MVAEPKDEAANALIKRIVLPGPTNTYFTYDANGSLVRMLEGSSQTDYSYGPHGLITRIKPPSEAATYFYYDGRLNRYKINQAGTIGYFLWEGMNLIEERDASGNIKARYTHGYTPIPGIGSVVEAQRRTTTTTYYQYHHMDHRGTVYAVTDRNQGTMISYAQDAFGRLLAGAGGTFPNAPNDLRYQTNYRTIQVGNEVIGISPSRILILRNGLYLQADAWPLLRLLHSSSIGSVLGVFDKSILDHSIRLRLSWPFLHLYFQDSGVLFHNAIQNPIIFSALPVTLSDTYRYLYCNSNPIQAVDPTGLTWVDGLIQGAVGVAVGAVVATVVIATAPAWLAVGLGVGAAAIGGFLTGVALDEFVTGKRYMSDERLTQDEIETRGGQLIVDAATLGLAKCKWFNKGAERDWDWVKFQPRKRLKHETGLITTTDDINARVENTAPAERALDLRDISPRNWGNTWDTGASPGLRYAWPYALSGEEMLPCPCPDEKQGSRTQPKPPKMPPRRLGLFDPYKSKTFLGQVGETFQRELQAPMALAMWPFLR